MEKYFSELKRLTQWIPKKSEDDCPICLENFSEKIGYELSCGHLFHADCLIKCYHGYLTCPICGHIYGIKTGTQPKGRMEIDSFLPGEVPLAGFEEVYLIH